MLTHKYPHIPYGLTHPELIIHESRTLCADMHVKAIIYAEWPIVIVAISADDHRTPSRSWPCGAAGLSSSAGPSYTPCPTPAWPPRASSSKSISLNICKTYSPQCCCPLCTLERVERLEEEERKRGTPVQQEIDDRDMENVCDFLFKDEDDEYEGLDESGSDDGLATPVQAAQSPRASARRLSTGSDMSVSSADSIFAHNNRTSSDTTLSFLASFACESDVCAVSAETATAPKPDEL